MVGTDADWVAGCCRRDLVVIATTILVMICGTAAGQRAEPLQLAPPVAAHDYRLGILVAAQPDGLRVTAVKADSPARRMRSLSAPGTIGVMEVGDVIRQVNGQPVKTVEEIRHRLDASNGKIRLSVLDTRSGLSRDWDVDPFRVVVTANRSAEPRNPNDPPILFAFLIANTDDAAIGAGVKLSLDAIVAQLKSRIRAEQLELTVLEGDRCRAETAVRELALVPSGDIDSILVYYLGHGAFDPQYGNHDPSHGHFMDFKRKDLLRRTVWEYLEAAPAKLRVVVTDACNVEGEADPFKYRLEQVVKETRVRGATNLEWLLMGHAGELDLSAAAPGEFSWYSNQSGGFFSNQWKILADREELTDWGPFLAELRQDANQYYVNQRAKILLEPGGIHQSILDRLRDQPRMTATTFRRELTRDAVSPVDPNLERTIYSTLTVRVPEGP